HRAHAPAADLLQQAVGADPAADEVGSGIERHGGGRVEEPARALVGAQQSAPPAPERGVVGAGAGPEGGAPLRPPAEGLLEDLLHARPGRRVHAPPPSSRNSQARARAQSRLTVAGEASITSAVSGTDRPPK